MALVMFPQRNLFALLEIQFPCFRIFVLYRFLIHVFAGGCGSMYQIVVECDDFKGLPKVRQHRMVTDTLKEEIASMHGVVVETSTPK